MLPPASQSMIAVNAVFVSLATVSVALRLYVRRKQRVSNLAADDWLILVALFFSIALAVTNIVGAPVGGFGVPFTSLSEEKAETFLKIMFVLQFWYLIAVAFVKLSILSLYGRLFSSGRFPIVVKVLLLLTTGWLIAFLFATFFQVWPIRCNWITCDPTTDYTVMYLCSSVTDIILDVIILCLPATFIRKLQLARSQKQGLIAVFGLGIFCIVASIARFVYSVRYVEVNISGNYAINFDGAVVNFIMWSGIEACTSVVCGNLPCYAPLLRNSEGQSKFSGVINSLRSTFSSPSRSRHQGSYAKSAQKTTSSESMIDDSRRNENFTSYDGRMRTNVNGGLFGGETQPSAQDLELRGIKVTTSMHVGDSAV